MILKHLLLLGWIENSNVSPSKDDELNIIFDNCARQIKNNMVIRLVPYFIETGVFCEVNFIFLIVGNAKNTADRILNTMKTKYRVNQCFTMDKLREVLRSKKVKVVKLESDDMKDWGEFLGKFYKKVPSIEPYHIFSCNSKE